MGNRKTEKMERSIGIDSLKSVIRALDTSALCTLNLEFDKTLVKLYIYLIND